MVVLASRTPPDSRTRAAAGASSAAGTRAVAAVPSGTGVPRVAMFSLSVNGTPSIGPSGSPAAQRASDAFASSRAAEGSYAYNACSSGSRASMRARTASVTSTGESVFARYRATSSTAVRSGSSVMNAPQEAGGSKRPSTAVQPPSTASTEPVTNDEASEARYTTAPASSSGRAQRPNAPFCAYASYHSGFALICAVSGVSTTPGAIALTRTPAGPNSAAAVRNSWTRPAFVAAYGPWPGSTVVPRIDEKPMMLPRPRATMSAPNTRTTSKETPRFSAMTRSNSSRV